MNLVINLSQRFERSPDGRVWTPGAFAYSFWSSYLEVFDQVRVLARVRDVAAAPAGWNAADGDGVVFTAIPYFHGPWQYLRRLHRIARTVRDAVGPNDAVILRVPSELARGLETVLRRRGHPFGVEVVGDPYEVFAPGCVRHWLRPLLRWHFPRQMRRQCAAACGAAYVTSYGLPRRYPCPAHGTWFSDVELPPEAWVPAPRTLDALTQPRSPASPFTLVSVGSLEQLYKAPDVLIDAVAVCVRTGWDLRLVLVGGGQYRAALEARAARLGLAERVHFLGQVPAGDGVRAVLDAADLFVLPSRTEGLPRALIEAMARALPCIGSRVGGIPELLPEEDLVEPGDVPGLAAKIAEVLADPERRARMSARNREKAGEYRPQILRQRRLTFYRHVRDRTQEWISQSSEYRVLSPKSGKPKIQHSALRTQNSELSGRTVLLHVTTVPQSLNFLRAQIRYLRGRDFQIHVLSSPGASLERFGAEQQVAAHAVSMSRRITPGRDLAALWRLARLLRRIRPDIVHGHTPKGGLLAMIAAWLSGVPVRLYHIHGLPLLTAVGLRRRLLRWTEKTACALAHEVLCVSPSVRQVALEQHLCPAEKIHVLLNGSIDGVDAAYFDPQRLPPWTRQLQRQQYGIPEQAVVLGFVGRIVRDKGLVELTHAWQSIRAEFPEAHLLLVGETEPQDPIPAATAAQLREDPRVHRVGVVRDMPLAYAAMDLVVLPTYREGFPVVPLEAAAMELPVLATRIPGCIDAIEDGITGTLVPPRDAEALANAIRGYLLDPARRLQHGRNGRRRVLRDFQPQALAQAIHDEYRRLLTERAARAGETFYQRRGKRWLDLALTIPALVVLAPLLLVIAVLVRLTLGAPVLFRQQRSGRHGKPFRILKFRTMTEERDAAGARLPDAQRLTRLGRFLRASSLDELPELFNVLKGEMSLVGPRPLIPRYLPYYSATERKRFERLPGLTGWAQVNGRNALGWDERLSQDAWYVDACSLPLDLQILCKTVWKVLLCADVHVDTAQVIRALDEERQHARDSEEGARDEGRGARNEGRIRFFSRPSPLAPRPSFEEDSTMKRLRILGTDQASEWMAVLARTAAYDFYHLPRYHQLAEEQGEGTARLFVWSEEHGTVALPLLLRPLEGVLGINGSSVGRRDATSVYGYAGPVASADALPETIGTNFRSALREALEEWGVVAVFSRLHPLIPRQVDWLTGLGECKALARTVSVDLTPPSKEQRARYRRNHKEGINKLRRQGVTAEYDRDAAHLPEFIAIYHETMRRVGAAAAYFFPPSYFANLRACLGPCLHLFVGRIAGEIACGALLVECNGILQYHLGATRDAFLRLAPMKLLLDEVREWATQRGLRVFHLGGGATARPDDSLLHFKMGFSDRTHDFCVWRYAPTPEVYDRLCRDKARWNEENRLRPTTPDYFPAYRCPTIATNAECRMQNAE